MKGVVEVRAWGKRVGAVAFDPQADCYSFNYAASWVKEGIEFSPLEMPTRNSTRPYVFPVLARNTFSGLPGMIADSLPDNWGNALVDAYWQSRGRARDSITVLDRLSYMGRRGLGALEFKPATGSRAILGEAIEIQSLVETARRAVQGDLSTEAGAAGALAHLINVGTSAGGARAKAVVAWNEATKSLRSGQFDVPPGYEHWILKFDGMGEDRELGGTQKFGRIEYAYYLMACAAGIQMSRCRLFEENGRAHFMTQRFDRDGNEKHHVQTLCALAHLDFRMSGAHDYAQAFMVLSQLGLGVDAVDQMFRRMAFNVMARNCDDHTKNIGFILKRGQSWALAPAYDLIFAHNPEGEWTAHHQMSVNGRFDGITREDFLVVAERFGVRRPAALLADVRAATDSFAEFALQVGLPDAIRIDLESQFQRV